MHGKERCKWIIREGRGVKYFAYTTCKSGFNPLTKVSRAEDIRPEYENRICPICGKNIEIVTELIEGE